MNGLSIVLRQGGILIIALLLPVAMAYGQEEPAPTLLINEIELNPPGRDAGAEWVEILNVSERPIDLYGWEITYTYRTPGSVPIVEEETILSPGGRYVFTYPSLMLRNDDPTPIELIDPEGNVVDRTPAFTDTLGNEGTWQRFPDGGDPILPDVWLFLEATRGAPNS